MKVLTQHRLKELLHYEYETGVFSWIATKKNAKAGKAAGTIMKDGYVRIKVDGTGYLAHRLVWLYVEGYFPENKLDHINRDRKDNRRENLREASHQCNMRNRGLFKNNKTGITGVVFRGNKYTALIRLSGKANNLGKYNNVLDAAKARWKAEFKYGYPNCNTTSSAYEYIKKHDPDFFNKPL